MVSIYLFYGLVLIFLTGAALSIILNKKERMCIYASFLSSIIGSILGMVFSILIIFGDNFSFNVPGSALLNFGIFVDRLSAFFILTISIAVFAVSIYSIGYSREYAGQKNIGTLGFFYNCFILSMVLVVSANNAVMFLIVWELMSVLSYFLVIYEHEKPQTRKAGLIYIIMTHIGTGFIILSFLILAGASGSFNFMSFQGAGSQLPSDLKDLVFLFTLIGFGTKAGIVPLHIWLPYAHPAAPSNVSALMSGVMIKTAIYMIIRITFDFLGADVLWWGILLLIVASISALLGVMYALMEHDMKRLLAYHSVENIGIILIGISLAMIFMSSGRADLAAFGLIAGLYHLINHAVFKSLLFMGAGSIIYSTHTKNIEELGGLIKKMPLTAMFFLIGAASISALPPLNGFMSEWMIFQSQLLSTNLPDVITIVMILVSGAALALTSALAAACFVKAFGISFLALPRSEHAQQAKEVPATMLFGMGVLSLLCIVLGVMPFYFVRILDLISSPIVGAGIGPDITSGLSILAISSGAGSVSTAWIAILIIALASLPILIYTIYRTSSSTDETWGCGQPISDARNEYTATAFSRPVQMWLSNIYRPENEIRATYSISPFFKESFRFESRIEPLFERYLYAPIASAVVSISRIIRYIQIGSIHAYLAYILITLIILLLFVLAGGKPV